MQRKNGFTLPELLAVTLIALLLGAAVTSGLSKLAARLHAQTALQTLTQAFAFTRSEAAKFNSRVTLRKNSTYWEQGWSIFVDANNNAQLDGGERILQETPSLAHWVTIRGNATVREYVSYLPTGSTSLVNGGWQAGTLTICAVQAKEFAHQLIINRAGRVRSSIPSNTEICTEDAEQ